MAAAQSNFISFTCDGPGCGNTTTFLMTKEERDKAVQESPWIDSIRIVKRAGDGFETIYCSDTCEIKAAGNGNHNKPEAKRIIAEAGNVNVALAAKAAEAAKAASERLKAGNAFDKVG